MSEVRRNDRERVAGHIRGIFGISGFSLIFTIKDTQEEAVKGSVSAGDSGKKS